MRYGFTFLDKKDPFIYQLVAILSEQMGAAFPEISEQKQLIENVIKEEENSFLRTLDQGLILLDKIIENAESKEIAGDKIFELYDTFGFPVDLTALILSEKGFTLDEKGFKDELQKQKNRSKAASEMSTEDWTLLVEEATEEFIGYDTLSADVKITRYRKVVSKKRGKCFNWSSMQHPFIQKEVDKLVM